MSTMLCERDERATAVENASYRWAYLFLSFGLLLIVAYRSFAMQESPWDLLGLVILAGLVSTAYQGFQKVLSKQWALVALVTIVSACVIAAGIVVLR